MPSFADARGVLERAIADRIFPAASIEFGDSQRAIWTEALGTLTFDAGSPRAVAGTSFDLASLTKVIATTTVVLDLVNTKRLTFETRIGAAFAEWRGSDREMVDVRDLLEHSSGLAARLFDAPPGGRREFEHEICSMPLEYIPRTRTIYSDLGFILLAFLAADRGGASFESLFDRFARATGIDLTFGLTSDARISAAPTTPLGDDPRRGRALAGEVHDSYAAALGGVAGHAGLFGTAQAVGAFARTVLGALKGNQAAPPFSPSAVGMMKQKSSVPGSSRALGWDTMLPTSSCGIRMSAAAIGHTGFTGTSLWIDPGRDRYFVLLTNRAYGDKSTDEMQRVRRAFHNALGDA